MASMSRTAAACLSAADIDGPAEWEPRAFERYAAGRVTDAKRSPTRRQWRPDSDDYDAPPANAVARPRQRSGGPASDGACDCSIEYEPFTLSGYYPDTLLAATCHGGHWCKEFVYPVLVLRKLGDGGERSAMDTGEYTAHGLPPELNSTVWRYAKVNLSVACFCPNDF